MGARARSEASDRGIRAGGSVVGAVIELCGQLQTSHRIDRPFDRPVPTRCPPGPHVPASAGYAGSEQAVGARGWMGRQLHTELPWRGLDASGWLDRDSGRQGG